MNISKGLLTKPQLMALVVASGLALGAESAVFFVDLLANSLEWKFMSSWTEQSDMLACRSPYRDARGRGGVIIFDARRPASLVTVNPPFAKAMAI